MALLDSDAGPNTKPGFGVIGSSWLLDCEGMDVPKGPFMAIASASSIGRPSDDSDAFDFTSLSLPPDENDCATLAGTELGRVGMTFLGVGWLAPLYFRQVLMVASRAATLWTALVRCSLTYMDSPAGNSSSSCSKVCENHIIKISEEYPFDGQSGDVVCECVESDLESG